MLYHIYKVDGTLGRLTGISSLNSGWYLAKLHALTISACRPDLLTGRTGVEEAISLTWLAEMQSVLTSHSASETFFPSGKPKRGIHIGTYSESDVGFKQHQNSLLHEAYYLYPSEIVAQFPKHSPVNVPHRTSLVDDLIYLSASITNKWSLNAPIMDDLSSWAEAWGNTIVEDYPSESSSFATLFSTSPATEISLHISNFLDKSTRAMRRFQVLFSLPLMVYSSNNRQCALLSTLVSFAKQPHIHLENLPHYAEYNFLDGYHPDHQCICDCIEKACHSRLADISATVEQLLGSWPSEIVPTASLDPDHIDMASLNVSLQPLFSC